MNLTFQINTLIEWDAAGEKSLVERILYIDPSRTDVVTIDVKAKDALPQFRKYEELRQEIIADRAHILFKGGFYGAPSLPDESHEKYAKYIAERDEAWDLISPLVELQENKLFSRKERGRLIAALAKKTGRRKQTIYNRLRRFWQRGQTKNALIPAWENVGHPKDDEGRKIGDKKLGRPRAGADQGRNVTPEDREIFEKGIKRFIRGGIAKNLPDAWQLIKERYYKIDDAETEDGIMAPVLPHASTLPSFDQFEHHYRKNYNPAAEIISKYGRTEYEANNRPLLDNSSKMAFGPGAVYQIDATVGDIYLLSYLDRTLVIGRPIIYLVIDVFSRLIVGLAVTLEGPSWEGARLALECAFTNKVAFCAKYGINITEDDWPVEGKCEAILGDNGEIKGYNANSLVEALGIRVMTAAVRRPDWKAIVERMFRTINNLFIEWQPGAVRPRREMKGKDYRLEAKLDLNQFRQMMIKCVLHYNNAHRLKKFRKDEFMIPKKVEPVPIKLWHYGMNLRSGGLQPESEDVIRKALLPRDKASTSPFGIYYKGLYYTCDMAIQEQLFVRKKGRRATRFDIVAEPLVNNIHLRLDRGRRFVTCELTPSCQRFKGRDWYEMREYFALEKQAERDAETEVQQSKADFHAGINAIVAEGEKMTNEAHKNKNLSNRALTSGTRDNRAALKSHERKHGAGSPADIPPVEGQIPAEQAKVVPFNNPQRSTPPQGYVPPHRPYDELREARREAKESGE